jgi:DNA-binding LytR/AlgR family response regulator
VDVLIVDDEQPALDALEFLLRQDDRIGVIRRADSAAATLRMLSREQVDAVFLDIHMPGLSGLELAKVMNRFASPPAIIFVTADDSTAVAAFDLDATDYLLKPVRRERLERAILRVAALQATPRTGDPTVTVIRGETIRRLRVDEVLYVQAQGDYARLHIDNDSFLLRTSMTEIEARWGEYGFVRIHRSFLVAMARVTSVKVGSDPVVRVAGMDLPVSRRLLAGVREAFDTVGPRT